MLKLAFFVGVECGPIPRPLLDGFVVADALHACVSPPILAGDDAHCANHQFAIGLALQGTLSNVGAGILLVFFRPFKIGHSVQIAGENGTVEELNLFSVVLKTADNKQIIIPNSAVIGKNITNFSAKPTSRIDLVFNIGYEDDLRLAKETLQSLIEAEDKVLKEPAPLVAVSELAQTCVKLTVRFWVQNEDAAAVSFSLTEKVKLTFDEKKISIPHPPLNPQTY